MIVGFTGTRRGLTNRQLSMLRSVLAKLSEECLLEEFRHGDCVRGDEAFHEMVHSSFRKPVVIIHPPKDNKLRAFCSGPNVTELPPRPYLARNKAIVDASDILIAAPHSPEVVRSGTWSTVRYAIKRGHCDVFIIRP